jgi:hypothetical protein
MPRNVEVKARVPDLDRSASGPPSYADLALGARR